MKNTRHLWIAATLLVAGCGRHYRVQGIVLEANSARSEMLVSHEAIPGYMPAMVMPFKVRRPAEISGLAPGSRVQFVLETGKTSVASRIRSLTLPSDAIEGVTLERPREAVPVGDPIPEFELTDHRGRRIRLSDFRGRLVALNFIYTRCPLPEVCPRLSASFASLQRKFREQVGSRLMLASVTLDPQFDTPAILSSYARQSGARDDGWVFLTGDTAPLARSFGLVHWAEEGVIVHTSVTGLIDSRGRLAARLEGSSYGLDQLAALVGHFLAQEARP